MPSTIFTSCSSKPLDVELPLLQASALDIDLSTVAMAQQLVPGPGAVFQPTLSQVAADPSHSQTRRASLSRPGYRGSTTGNWMRNGDAGLSQRSNAKR